MDIDKEPSISHTVNYVKNSINTIRMNQNIFKKLYIEYGCTKGKDGEIFCVVKVIFSNKSVLIFVY